MEKKINLTAGQWAELPGPGRHFLLLNTGAAASVDLQFVRENWPIGEVSNVERGFSLSVQGKISTVRIKSPVDATVSCFLSDEAASVSFPDTGSVEATIVGTVPVSVTGQPINVVPDRGAPGAPVHVVGLTYSDAPATAIVDRAPVACGPVAVVLLAADSARKRARFCNLGPDPVTLGTTGHTWAKRCIVLEMGDMWTEDDAANLAWSGITDAGKSASITVQEVMA